MFFKSASTVLRSGEFLRTILFDFHRRVLIHINAPRWLNNVVFYRVALVPGGALLLGLSWRGARGTCEVSVFIFLKPNRAPPPLTHSNTGRPALGHTPAPSAADALVSKWRRSLLSSLAREHIPVLFLCVCLFVWTEAPAGPEVQIRSELWGVYAERECHGVDKRQMGHWTH